MVATPKPGLVPAPPHPALRVAAAASVAAGLVHAAAAGSHSELRTLSLLFAVTAVAQIGWGAAAVLRPRTATAALGVGIHLAALGAWLASRTVGIAAVEGLEGRQAIGFPDGLAAGLQALAVLGIALALTTDALPRLARVALPAVAAVLAVATVPAMAQPHDHGAHDHGDAAAELAAGGHEHDDGHVHDDSHDHGDGHEDGKEGRAHEGSGHDTVHGAAPAGDVSVATGCDHGGETPDVAERSAAADEAPDHDHAPDAPDHDH